LIDSKTVWILDEKQAEAINSHDTRPPRPDPGVGSSIGTAISATKREFAESLQRLLVHPDLFELRELLKRFKTAETRSVQEQFDSSGSSTTLPLNGPLKNRNDAFRTLGGLIKQAPSRRRFQPPRYRGHEDCRPPVA
jgi:hypothetical protein